MEWIKAVINKRNSSHSCSMPRGMLGYFCDLHSVVFFLCSKAIKE